METTSSEFKNTARNRRIISFVVGGIFFAGMLAFGIWSELLLSGLVIGLCGFSLISCLILANNFVGDMIAEIFSWGFVRMPCLIFTLDLDGIIWLLTVKLLFWLLGIALAICTGILALILGGVVSVFVFPFALYKSIKHPEETE